jgi:poly(3-hydroxybutyrate) depolymerase
MRFYAKILVLTTVLTGCTQCGGDLAESPAMLVPPGSRVRSVFTSRGPYEGGSLTGAFVLHVPQSLGEHEQPGLLLSFHADGRARRGWDDPGALNRLARTGERFKLVTVAMQEPHKHNWWQGKVAENVRYVDDFIESYLLRRLSIDTRHLFFTGVSGGADFAGCIFPPQTRYKYQGAALVTCGGDLPSRMLAPPPVAVTDGMRRNFRFYFADVEDDPDFPPALVDKTVGYFQGLGFRVERVQASHTTLDGQRDMGTGHCSFDTPGWRDRFLEAYFADEAKAEGLRATGPKPSGATGIR